MARPRYAEMLVNRRRQLGLSITQASQVLRLKEQVLIAFEEGDFDRIPKSGYAQGMLSSYARYLGLNSRQIVDQFSQDLYEYADERRRELRLEGTGAIRTFAGTDAGPYVESRGLLPTSGGLAGDMGAFSTTSQPHSRSQATPLVSSRRYVGTAGRSTESAVDGALGDYGQERPYTTRQPAATRTRTAQGRTYGRGSDGITRRSYTRDPYAQDQVTTRLASDSDYEEDLRYDDGYESFETLTSDEATMAATQSYAERTTRTRKRSSSQRRNQTQAPSRQGGLVGSVISFFSDPRHLIPLVVILLCAILTGIIIFSVQSCTRTDQTTDDKTVPISSTETTESTDAKKDDADKKTADADKTDSTDKTDADATKEDNDKTSTDAKATTEAKETKVTVSVESGMVSWLNIQCDGESKVGDTVTGPWSETYTVHDSISIEAGEPTAVTVTENGVRRQFENKTSGLGYITIQGTPLPEEDNTKTDNSTSSDDKTNSESADSSTENTESSDNSQKTSTDTSEDEYLYEYNGYDIYYNAENDLYYFFDENGVKYNASNGEAIG